MKRNKSSKIVMGKTGRIEKSVVSDVFKTRINELCNDRGSTASQMAKEAGISAAAMNFYKQGDRRPDLDALFKICSAFGCSADWLIGLTDVRSSSNDVQTAVTSLGIDERFIEGIMKLDEPSRSALFSLLTISGFNDAIIPDLIELERVYGAMAEENLDMNVVSGGDMNHEKRLNIEEGSVVLSKKEAVKYYAYKIGSNISKLMREKADRFLSVINNF